MTDLIEKIAKRLNDRYHHIKFHTKGDNELTILPNGIDGFEILIENGEREHTMHFNTWHFHFDATPEGEEELFNYLGFGMSRLGRLKAYSKNGKEYKWTFETKNEDDGIWYSAGTLRVFNFKFWQKPQIKYYQNNLINIDRT